MTNPLHPLTNELVDRFAMALKEKLLDAQIKYGFTDNWARLTDFDELRAALERHMDKGDPVDVAVYSMFLWHYGQITRLPF